MSDRKSDTRTKIQQIALELFAEQGYEKTSLREIAERLGVTKAALYYHFKTKEDIVGSLFDDFLTHVDEIVEWGTAREMDAAARKEVIRRYSEVLIGPGEALIQFVQGNQSAVRELKDARHLFERFKVLSRLLMDPSASVISQLRSSVALSTLHVGFFGPFEITGTVEERRAAALQIAIELIEE
jgi:AcrR family transcriptional regulator